MRHVPRFPRPFWITGTSHWRNSTRFSGPRQAIGGIPRVEIEAETVIAAIDDNFEERADRVAASIRNTKIDFAFYHNGLTEQTTTRVAALRPARFQIKVKHA